MLRGKRCTSGRRSCSRKGVRAIMKFADAALIRLGDDAARKSLFGPIVAERLVAACYGAGDVFSGPFRADPANVTIGAAIDFQPRLRGGARCPDGRLFEFDADLVDLAPVRASCPVIIEGTISATLADVSGRISTVKSAAGPLPTLELLDAGVPPAVLGDPDKLERSRRIKLARALAGAALEEDVALLLAEEWTGNAGVSDIPEFLDAASGPATATRLEMQFELLDGNAAPRQRTARFAAGVLVGDPADAEFGFLTMLNQSREAQRLLRASGHLTAPLGGIEPVVATPVVWFVPRTAFNDDHWPVDNNVQPAGRPGAREKRAAAWLAQQGIVLAGIE